MLQIWIRRSSVLFLVLLTGLANGQSPDAPPLPEAIEQPGTGTLIGDGRLQLSDDQLFPLEPVRTAKGVSKEALAWFMTGQLRQARNDLPGAMKAFEQALSLDSKAIAIYRSLVPLAFSMNQTEKAIKYAMQAVELDPDDFLLLRRLGIHMASQRNLPEATKLLEQARQSRTIDKRSAIFVTINRDLAVIYRAQNELEKSADCSEVVLNALAQPSKFDLDTRFRRALLGDPAISLERMGQLFADTKRFDLAVKALELAVREGQGTRGAISFDLAVVYRKQEQYEQALEQLRKYFDAQLQSQGDKPYELLEQLLEDVGRGNELVSELEKIAERDPRNATLQFFLASRLVALEELDRAEQLYRKSLESNEDSRGYLGLIGIYRRREDAAGLLPLFSRAAKGKVDTEALQTELEAIAKSPDLVKSLIEQARQLDGDAEGEPTVDGYYVLAKLCLAAELSSETTDFFEKAMKLKPPREKRFMLYEEFGNHLLDVDDFGRASEVFQQAANDPLMRSQRPMLLFRLSQARELNGETDMALEAVLEARKILPNVPLLHYQEAWIYYHAQRWDEAIRQFESVIKQFAGDKETVRRCQFSLSNIYVQQGDIRRGEQILEEVLAEDPDDPSVNNDLGYLYADQNKNLEKAEQMIRKAVTAEPENSAYQDSMGWVLYRLGRFKEAMEWLKKATDEATSDDATLWDHLGDCHHALEQSSEARSAWERALEAARKQSRTDEKLIRRLEEKLNQ